MIRRTFHVTAVWDDEAGVYVSDSDIIGFHIEATTLEEFESLMNECALDLIIANHRRPEDFAEHTARELLPTIIWERPREVSEPA
jgi:hypothetical protein